MHPVPFGAVDLIAKLGLWHGAPTALIQGRQGGKSDLDCGIAGQNMALAAHSMGLAPAGSASPRAVQVA